MSAAYTFTSESVSDGHPDKIADLISDKILDAILSQDPSAKVACETYIKTGMVIIGGEITTHANIDYENIVRQTIIDIGYNHTDLGFDGNTCAVINVIGKQSPDIARGLVDNKSHEQGAGDQGLMFGYACQETKAYLPAPIYYAHALMQQQRKVRKANILPWLRPDAKSQVSLRYEHGRVVGLDACVLSTQHAEIDIEELRAAVMQEIIKPVIPSEWIDSKSQFLINPTGRFVIGGPMGDCGLTGRKIIVDTYGGMARHGGGAFSGKDPSKVDRSAAYMCRHVAKLLVAAGLAEKLEIQVSYAIGKANPVSIFVESFGTGKLANHELAALVRQHFDFKPKSIIEYLKLRRPIYALTTNYGHFGRDLPDFSWESLDQLEKLKAALK